MTAPLHSTASTSYLLALMLCGLSTCILVRSTSSSFWSLALAPMSVIRPSNMRDARACTSPKGRGKYALVWLWYGYVCYGMRYFPELGHMPLLRKIPHTMLWNVMYAMVWLCVLWYAVFSGARTYALAPLGHMALLRCPALAHSSQSGLKDSSSGFGLGLLIKGSPLLLAGSPLLLAACPLPLARSFSFLSFLSCSI